ncbi:acyl-CoA thioesterase [Acetivibrio clariflavus]|uniref:Acyl-CoA thioester hydrolase, YbgC/YbaW family n=1 Tax=Acetivibrio clariflavus (strain DSM 19732 / NBRC 101661 / EBR45) TaxID=720554 RepID=G8LXR7_ACECE|nr:thioesterase family protein [Acetivibrio clariflavus]AEV68820.1 acyl-CoA thioester hydrolase, YbgC/YbaW family [Acetivibrio clariflavus DSM 19732]
MYTSKTEIVVRYAETDQMGIAHHSNYPIWYEAARTDFIKGAGISYSEIEKRGCMLPLLELKSCYKKPARYEDELFIITKIKDLSSTRITFYYEVYDKKENTLLNYGETMHVWTDKNLRPVNMKKYAPDIYNFMLKLTQEDTVKDKE